MWKHILKRLPRKSVKSESTNSLRNRTAPSSQKIGNTGTGRLHPAKRTSSAVFPAGVMSGIDPLLPFKDVPNSEKMNLFISKLSLCCVVFDFTDPSESSSDKDLKRVTLIELLDYVSSGPPMYTEPAILAVCKMCSLNLFRVFPPHYRSNMRHGENDDDDHEPIFDPAWTHLQLVYEILLKFVSSSTVEAKVAKKYINHSFILRLLDLFESEDPRERECLKGIMHKIYGKFMVHRPFIRKNISNIFSRFVNETDRCNGIAELLEIFGSVITGFALPIKEEHKIFLWRAVIPLHKPKALGAYFQQLSYCVMQFIEKDPQFASTVIRGLLKYWPVTNSQKEVMFLSEIEEILEIIDMDEFQKVMALLFRRIRCCISSSHFQVAERALFLWNNDHIVNLIAHNRHVILPLIFPALENNVHSHWNHSVLNLTLNVRKLFLEMDDELFWICHSRFMEEQFKLTSETEKRKEAWKHLESVASQQPITGNTAVLVKPWQSKFIF
ncbi:Serine/threonine protein phosphatase 2A regulatory subunit [Heracleum sosnowskyi]|uniref:Serine/threonine protein phosphatase 2A regulatory subunit n=1 Tax=Heracleum sosnowskyi TaxID=360622 RepID=A0AAD8MSZ4_9APIA|nr:Serine/threonine protein phosphatase 2A regulatory subunit [Heracleum sosnowskyi]